MTQVEAEVVRTYRWKADIKGDYRGDIREYFKESKVVRWSQEELV